MSDKNQEIYILFYEADGIPSTVDGAWAGVLGAYEDKGDAESEMSRIKKESLENEDKWGWLGRFEFDAENESDDTSTRGLRLSIESAEFFKKKVS